MQCNGKEILWSHLTELYSRDTAAGQGIRMVPNTAFTLVLRTVPALFSLGQHSYDRKCKRVITVLCWPSSRSQRGLAQYGTVIAASVNANCARLRGGVRLPCRCSAQLIAHVHQLHELYLNFGADSMQAQAKLQQRSRGGYAGNTGY